MAEVDEIAQQIARADAAGDVATVHRLSTTYRDAQVRAGSAPLVGRFAANSGREYQLASRALELRRAGREDEAKKLTRVLARERVAANITQNGGGRGTAFGAGVNRGLLNVGTFIQGGLELAEDTLGGNRNNLTAREVMEDSSAVQDLVRARHPLTAAAGEVTGSLASIAAPGGAGVKAVQGASRVGRVGLAAATGAGYGAAQGASDATVRNRDVVAGTVRGARDGAIAGGALSVFGQAAAPAVRGLANRMANEQGLRLLAEHVSPEQLQKIVLASRQLVRQNGTPPTLLEASSLADKTIAREAGNIVASQVPASQVAQQGVRRVREQTQGRLAESIRPGTSTNSAVTTEATSRTMQNIQGSAIIARRGTPIHNFLTSEDVASALTSLPPSVRTSFNEAIDNGGPVTVRMLDDLRQEMGNLAKNKGASRAYNDVANTARQFADDASGGAYNRILRDHGQSAFREELANKALASPAAARSTATDLAEGARTRRDITEQLGPAAAEQLRRVGSTTRRVLEGVDEFDPRRTLSRGEKSAENIKEAANAALLPKMGGAGTAAFLARQVARLGVSPAQAEKFASDFTDPSQTTRAIAFLEQRIGKGPARQFMQMLEQAGVRPTVERVAAIGSRVAGRGPQTEEVQSTGPVAEAQPQQPQQPQPSVELTPDNVRLSGPARDIAERAASLESENPEIAAEFRQVAKRLAFVEMEIARADAASDAGAVKRLAAERRAILNNER